MCVQKLELADGSKRYLGAAHREGKAIGNVRLPAAVLSAVLTMPVLAQPQGPGHAPDGEIQPTAVVQQLSESDLKAFYVRCSRAAMQRALSGADIALCSVAYERLLKRTFRGDFLALLAWSRNEPE